MQSTDTKNTSAAAASTNDLSAWDMSRSLLSGLEQTLEKAREENEIIRAENPDKPHIGGGIRHLIEALMEAKRDLEPELHKIAKSNGWDL